ncbi:MAG: Uncharacterised protein [Gammaproteobacteria bacterium]|nr:MAG: Uncharacterised protein [Gammaproteobacteria bacterium]
MTDYPRDMLGYAGHPPQANWPSSARLAVQIVLNFEEGAENSILHGDSGSETFLSEIINAESFSQRHMSMESLYEYGSRAGFWRLHDLFNDMSIPITVFGVGMAMERNAPAVEAMLRANWDIASHAYRWISHQEMPLDEERQQISLAFETHQRVTGSPPLGWYTGRDSPNTRKLLLEQGGLLYDSDSYADDLPFWHTDGERPHLIIPYTLDTNDMRFATPQGFNSGQQFFTYLKDAFDELYEEGARAPKMLNIGLHCRIAGRPGRTRALRRFLEYMLEHQDVWICRRIDIAQHWHAHHSPSGDGD